MNTQRASVVHVVEAYIKGLGEKDLSQVPFAPDFILEGPLVPALAGQPRLAGEAAILFLTGLFPAITGVQIKQHICEGEYCASLFDLHTLYGIVPILDRFQVVEGRLKLVNPFFDPGPILSAMSAQAS